MRQLTPDGAEFLVLGNLLVRGIYAHKNYINTPDYDVVAINPRNKKVVKTHGNYVRNGCLRNVLKIDGFLTKTDLQNVPKTMPKLRFLGNSIAPDFWHVFEACFGSKIVPTCVQNGAQNDPRNR